MYFMAVARDTALAWPDSRSAPTNITVITNNQLYEDSALAFGILHVAISRLMLCDAQSARKKLEISVGCEPCSSNLKLLLELKILCGHCKVVDSVGLKFLGLEESDKTSTLRSR